MTTDAELRDEAVAHLKQTTTGYRKSNGQPKPPPWPEGSTHWKAALDLLAQIDQAAPPDPPDPPDPPANPSPPITITKGGTYSGYWQSSGTADSASSVAVTIATSEPVVLENSIFENTAGGRIFQCSHSGAQVTIRNSRFLGRDNGIGRAVASVGWKSWHIEACTIEYTGGIYLQAPQGPGATVMIRRNRHLNVTGQLGALRQFVQLNGVVATSSLIVEWNEIRNEFGKSFAEDVISTFNTDHATIRHNYIEGGYPDNASDNHSGTGIILADANGNFNVAHDNQIVGITNLAIGITGGHDNEAYRNRCVSDGRLPNGTALFGANNGIVCWDAYNQGAAMRSNRVYENHIGCMQGARFTGAGLVRMDYWCPKAANNVEADNTYFYGNHSTPITKADEDGEWPIWQQKLTANSITIGAS